MANIENLSPEELKMQGLLGRYLVARVATERSANAGADHLDDDTLSAFVEGSLSAREAKAIVSHLVDGILSRIFGTRDGAVFAHHEDDKEAEDNSENAEEEKEDNEKN